MRIIVPCAGTYAQLKTIKTCKYEIFLTVVASDSIGGSGIQQDCKVAHDLAYWIFLLLTGIVM